MFAPVGRGTPGHPDRGRQRHGRQEDGPFAGAQPVQHQQGDQAQHVVPRPTRASPDGRTGRSVRSVRRRARGRAAATSPAPRGARPTAGAPNRASATACHANACGRGWTNGRVGAGRRRPSAAGRASSSTPHGRPTWQPPRPRATTWPDTSTCSCSPTCAPATSATRPCSVPPGRSPSAPCCRSQQARQRPLTRRDGAGHHQHHRTDRHRSPVTRVF